LKNGPYRKTGEVITDGTPAHSPEPVPELFRLSRLADAHSLHEFSNPTNADHRQLLDIMRARAGTPSTRLGRMKKRLGPSCWSARPKRISAIGTEEPMM
jgi:hypothetical protein